MPTQKKKARRSKRKAPRAPPTPADLDAIEAEDGPLTERERRFVVAFAGAAAGNATSAARMAGYSDSTQAVLWSTASRVLARPRVLDAIREATANDPLVACKEERQRFWSRVMRGDPVMHTTDEGVVIEMPPAIKDRLKASELLGKACGDFVERIDLFNHDLSKATDEQLARIAGGDDPVKVLGGAR